MIVIIQVLVLLPFTDKAYFKIVGTVFYFAAESEEELAAWMDCLSMATFALDVSTSKSSVSEGNYESIRHQN